MFFYETECHIVWFPAINIAARYFIVMLVQVYIIIITKHVITKDRNAAILLWQLICVTVV